MQKPIINESNLFVHKSDGPTAHHVHEKENHENYLYMSPCNISDDNVEDSLQSFMIVNDITDIDEIPSTKTENNLDVFAQLSMSFYDRRAFSPNPLLELYIFIINIVINYSNRNDERSNSSYNLKTNTRKRFGTPDLCERMKIYGKKTNMNNSSFNNKNSSASSRKNGQKDDVFPKKEGSIIKKVSQSPFNNFETTLNLGKNNSPVVFKSKKFNHDKDKSQQASEQISNTKTFAKTKNMPEATKIESNKIQTVYRSRHVTDFKSNSPVTNRSNKAIDIANIIQKRTKDKIAKDLEKKINIKIESPYIRNTNINNKNLNLNIKKVIVGSDLDDSIYSAGKSTESTNNSLLNKSVKGLKRIQSPLKNILGQSNFNSTKTKQITENDAGADLTNKKVATVISPRRIDISSNAKLNGHIAKKEINIFKNSKDEILRQNLYSPKLKASLLPREGSIKKADFLGVKRSGLSSPKLDFSRIESRVQTPKIYESHKVGSLTACSPKNIKSSLIGNTCFQIII